MVDGQTIGPTYGAHHPSVRTTQLRRKLPESRSSRHDHVLAAALTPDVSTELTTEVTIEALSNTNATRISDHAVDVAASPRGIVPPAWPTGLRKHTVTFDRL
jgi:hypothetical protein